MSPYTGTVSSEGKKGGRRKVGEQAASNKAEQSEVYVSSSKRRSYGSWLSGQRGEVLKTNSLLNRGRDASEATFLLLFRWLGSKRRATSKSLEQSRSHEVQTSGKTRSLTLQKKVSQTWD